MRMASVNVFTVGPLPHSDLVGNAILNIPDVDATLFSVGTATPRLASASRGFCDVTPSAQNFDGGVDSSSCFGRRPGGDGHGGALD